MKGKDERGGAMKVASKGSWKTEYHRWQSKPMAFRTTTCC